VHCDYTGVPYFPRDGWAAKPAGEANNVMFIHYSSVPFWFVTYENGLFRARCSAETNVAGNCPHGVDVKFLRLNSCFSTSMRVATNGTDIAGIAVGDSVYSAGPTFDGELGQQGACGTSVASVDSVMYFPKWLYDNCFNDEGDIGPLLYVNDSHVCMNVRTRTLYSDSSYGTFECRTL